MNPTDSPNDTAPSGLTPGSEHLRPVRQTREVRLPLAVRRELLITRAALERYDFAESLHQVRYRTQRLTRLGAWLPRSRSKSVMNLLGLAKDYPMLSSAISLGLPLLRKTPLLRWTWKLSKFGLIAGAGYWAYGVWREMKHPHPARPPSVMTTTGGAGGAAPSAATAAPTDTTPTPTDTGFRDPLVR